MKNHGVLPSAVGEEPPHALYDAAFGQSSKAIKPAAPMTPLAVLAKLNRERAAKGLQPVASMFGKTLEHLPDA